MYSNLNIFEEINLKKILKENNIWQLNKKRDSIIKNFDGNFKIKIKFCGIFHLIDEELLPHCNKNVVYIEMIKKEKKIYSEEYKIFSKNFFFLYKLFKNYKQSLISYKKDKKRQEQEREKYMKDSVLKEIPKELLRDSSIDKILNNE